MLKHRSTIDVRFYELDPYNHINHTMYLAYCEVARVEALDSRGLDMSVLEERGFRIIVVNLSAKFLTSAVGGDRLEIVTDVIDVRRASTEWVQHIERNGHVIFTLAVRAAITDLDGTPVRIPDFFRSALEA